MTKIIDNRYELTACTAIAASIGDTDRQNAIFFHDIEDINRDGDAVIFGGYDLNDIESTDDLFGIDSSAFSTDCEDLDTVQF